MKNSLVIYLKVFVDLIPEIQQVWKLDFYRQALIEASAESAEWELPFPSAGVCYPGLNHIPVTGLSTSRKCHTQLPHFQETELCVIQ